MGYEDIISTDWTGDIKCIGPGLNTPKHVPCDCKVGKWLEAYGDGSGKGWFQGVMTGGKDGITAEDYPGNAKLDSCLKCRKGLVDSHINPCYRRWQKPTGPPPTREEYAKARRQEPGPCKPCGGTGTVKRARLNRDGQLVEGSTVKPRECKACNGTVHYTMEETFQGLPTTPDSRGSGFGG